ncbi:4082_t:CDS:2, partial [Dentiscutata heterogama]
MCHFHLAQSVYRRIQVFGLATHYGTDKDFSILMRHIPALAFLPHSEIPAMFDELKNLECGEELVPEMGDVGEFVPRPPLRRQAIEHELHIQSVYNDHNHWSFMEYLR